MIAKKEGDWYPKGLKEKDFRGLYGYQVFLAIAVFMGDGLYNLAKIGVVSARAYADQRRELAEAMAAQQQALRSSQDGGSSDGGSPSRPSFLPTAAPGAPPSAAAAARAREQAHERRVAGATRLRLMASFRRGMTALEPKKLRSSVVANGDESPTPSSPPSSVSGSVAAAVAGAAGAAAAASGSRPPLAPPPTDRELQARPAAAKEDKVMPSGSTPASPSGASSARPSASGLVCRRPRLPSRDDDDARARAALDDRRDEIFMRDAIPSWVGYTGYLAFGLLGVTVIPLLYPACK